MLLRRLAMSESSVISRGRQVSLSEVPSDVDARLRLAKPWNIRERADLLFRRNPMRSTLLFRTATLLIALGFVGYAASAEHHTGMPRYPVIPQHHVVDTHPLQPERQVIFPHAISHQPIAEDYHHQREQRVDQAYGHNQPRPTGHHPGNVMATAQGHHHGR